MDQIPRHPEVNQENPTAFEPKNQILAAPVELRDSLALQLGCHRDRIEGTHETWVVDHDALEPSPDERRLELATNGLDLG